MSIPRRAALIALSGLGLLPRDGHAAEEIARLRAVPHSEPMRQLAAGGPSGLLGIGASGALWALSPAAEAPRRLGEGLDPATPMAVGHGRIAARRSDGALWVLDGSVVRTSVEAALAPHAGLLILPLAVIATVLDGRSHRLVRLEPDAAQTWAEVARSPEAVLPDGRPLQVDLDGSGNGGHLAVLAGPDAERYTHGVLGDAVEATRVLYLERHSLQVQRELSIAAPYVLEDLLLRPVALAPGRSGLLGVRSGPQGAQLLLIDADPARPRALRVAASGEPLGSANRWLAPTSDGQRMLAVHTPHIGGVLHEYRREGERLVATRLFGDVSNHRIGSRELDLGLWRGRWLMLPDQTRKRLRWFDSAAGWREAAPLPLPAGLVASLALVSVGSAALLLDDGQVMSVTLSAPT